MPDDQWDVVSHTPTAPNTDDEWSVVSHTPTQLVNTPKPNASGGSVLPESMGSLAVHALPMVGAGLATLGTAGMGAFPAMGMAALGGGFGSAAEQGIERGYNMPDAPKTMGDFGGEVGKQAGIAALGEGTGRFLNAALAKVFGRAVNPQQLYQSALRPSPSSGTTSIDKMVNTGLSEKIPLGPKAGDLVSSKMRGYNSQIDNMISSNPTGATIDPNTVRGPISNLRNEWAQGTGDPAYQDQINNVEQNFLSRHPQPMSPVEAQTAKKSIYKEIRKDSSDAWQGGPQPNTLGIQAKQEITNSLMKEIQSIYPQVQGLNQKVGGLSELQQAVDKYVAREGNYRISPYFATVAAGAAGGGALAGHSAEGLLAAGGTIAASILRNMFEDPAVKSKLAIALYRAGNTMAGQAVKTTAPYVAPNTVRLGANVAHQWAGRDNKDSNGLPPFPK